MSEQDLLAFTKRLGLLRTLARNGEKDLESENAARRHARRSIVAVREIRRGEVCSENNFTNKRSAHGVCPIHWDVLIGRHAACDIGRDTALPLATIQGGFDCQ